MITRTGNGSSFAFVNFFTIVAAALTALLMVSCAEGGGTGLIEQFTVDASVVPDSGPVAPAGFCGDGVVNLDVEQCDGTDLDGMTCALLGEGTGGTLGCYQASCTFDTSMCMDETTTAGAGGAYGGGTGGGI